MWISQEKWIALTSKVESLEKRLEEAQSIRVYEPIPKELLAAYPTAYWHPTSMTIHVHDLLRQVITKMGMELKLVQGQAARVDLAPKEQK